MSFIRIKILKVVSKTENKVKFKGTYYGGHEIFSPKGFIAEVRADPNVFIDGFVYIETNFPKTKILEFGEGHYEIMKEFEENFKNLSKNANDKN